MNKQSSDGNIGWTDYTWNPVRGLCPVNCKLPDGRSYCYARAMYKRFKMNPEVRLEIEELRPTAWKHLFKKFPKKPSKIFVCSTIEIFHPLIKKAWRDWIFKSISLHPQHTFQILTKMPENIDRPMPDNVWLGVSVTCLADYHERIHFLSDVKAKIKFMSIEPLLELSRVLDGAGRTTFRSSIEVPGWLGWVIVGKLTGHGKVFDPKKYWIEELVERARNTITPIFLKNNLISIVGKEYVMKYQEFPDAKV